MPENLILRDFTYLITLEGNDPFFYLLQSEPRKILEIGLSSLVLIFTQWGNKTQTHIS